MKRLFPTLLCLLILIPTLVAAAEAPSVEEGLVYLTLSPRLSTLLEFDCTFGGILCPNGGCAQRQGSDSDRSEAMDPSKVLGSLLDPPGGGGDNEETRLVISNEGGPAIRAAAPQISFEITAGSPKENGEASGSYSAQIKSFDAYGDRYLVLNDPDCGRWSSAISLNQALVPAPVPLNIITRWGDGSGTFFSVLPIPLKVTFRSVTTGQVIQETVMVHLELDSEFVLTNPTSPSVSNFLPFVSSSSGRASTGEAVVLDDCMLDLNHDKARFCFRGGSGLAPLW